MNYNNKILITKTGFKKLIKEKEFWFTFLIYNNGFSFKIKKEKNNNNTDFYICYENENFCFKRIEKITYEDLTKIKKDIENNHKKFYDDLYEGLTTEINQYDLNGDSLSLLEQKLYNESKKYPEKIILDNELFLLKKTEKFYKYQNKKKGFNVNFDALKESCKTIEKALLGSNFLEEGETIIIHKDLKNKKTIELKIFDGTEKNSYAGEHSFIIKEDKTEKNFFRLHDSLKYFYKNKKWKIF